MSRPRLLFFAAPALLLAACQSNPQGEPTARTPEELAEMQAAILASAVPGPQHEMLARYAGDWDIEITMWPTPGGHAVQATASGTNRMILDGRFLEIYSEGPFFGSVVKAISILGFDVRHERFTTVGFDTFGTYYITADGPWDEGTRSTRMSGNDDDPIAGFTQEYDFVMTFIDDDTYSTEIIFKNKEQAPDGPTTLAKQISRRRR